MFRSTQDVSCIRHPVISPIHFQRMLLKLSIEMGDLAEAGCDLDWNSPVSCPLEESFCAHISFIYFAGCQVEIVFREWIVCVNTISWEFWQHS